MLGVGAATRIYVATGATDMRLGFNGLYGLVRERLECEPTNGHLYRMPPGKSTCSCRSGGCFT
jgi:transposase